MLRLPDVKALERRKDGSKLLAKCQKSRHCSVEIKGCWTRTRLPRVHQPRGSPDCAEDQADLRKCRNDRAKGCWLSADCLCSILPIQLPSHLFPTAAEEQLNCPFLGGGIQRPRTDHSQGDAGVASYVLLTDSDLCHTQSVWARQRGADLLCRCGAALLNICSGRGRVLIVSSSFPEMGWGAATLFLLSRVVTTSLPRLRPGSRVGCGCSQALKRAEAHL